MSRTKIWSKSGAFMKWKIEISIFFFSVPLKKIPTKIFISFVDSLLMRIESYAMYFLKRLTDLVLTTQGEARPLSPPQDLDLYFFEIILLG